MEARPRGLAFHLLRFGLYSCIIRVLEEGCKLNYLVFLLLMLVMIDHVMKYRPEGLVFYKNNHKYSIIVALLEEPPHLDNLASLAQSGVHEWIFVNVNQAIDSSVYSELTIVDVDIDFTEYANKTEALSAAYLEGYKHTSHDYLLFMNGALQFTEPKFITHMANNLVEHQVYTIKETLPERTNKEGFKLFFDLFDDMETTADNINVNFFSVKRITFELCEGHTTPFKSARDFQEKLFSKNINVLHIDHSKALKKVEKHKDFKHFISRWTRHYAYKGTHGGLRRMLMMLLAFHLFYVFMILDFSYVNLLFIVVIHMTFYVIIARRANHTLLAYFLIPFYMLLFDWCLLVASLKRLKHTRKQHKKTKESV